MKCDYIKKDKAQCNSNAMNRSSFCYHHNPEIPDKEKREAQRRGGLNRALTLKNPLPEMEIGQPNDVILLLADTIKRVRAGKLDVRAANCLGMLSGQLIRAFEVVYLTEKVDKILERIDRGEIRTY